MDEGLRDKVVVVTGASRGIGYSCARAFLDAGARVCLVSRSNERLARAAASLGAGSERIHCVACDLVDPASGPAMASSVNARFGAIDVLVNSAGAAKNYPVDELGPSAYRQAMDAKYFTYVHAIDAVIHAMAQRRAGIIVNIIGKGGKTPGVTHIAGGAANSALMLVTAGMAVAYADRGLRINGINPGTTLTPRAEDRFAAEGRATGRDPLELIDEAARALPMKRFARPEEIAAVAVFLSSDRASYINGVIIPMDGAQGVSI